MAFKIITADERLRAHSGVKMIVVGGYGIGKTSLLKTLDTPALCLDLEAGLLAVQDWNGPVISIRTWPEARDIACLIGGPNPAIRPDHPYSVRHFESLEKDIDFAPFQVIFIDSLTVASRLCFAWCKQQPEAFSERTGQPNALAAYAMLGYEMTNWLNQFQHIPGKDIVFTALLDQRMDDAQKSSWQIQCEGSKTAQEIPGILDEVVSMVANSEGQRVFVCQTVNPGRYPAKDRSGRLDLTEPADLGALLKKIKQSKPTSKAASVLDLN